MKIKQLTNNAHLLDTSLHQTSLDQPDQDNKRDDCRSREPSGNDKAIVVKRIVANQKVKKTKITLPLKIANIKKSEVSLALRNLDSNLTGINPSSLASFGNNVSDLSGT